MLHLVRPDAFGGLMIFIDMVLREPRVVAVALFAIVIAAVVIFYLRRPLTRWIVVLGAAAAAWYFAPDESIGLSAILYKVTTDNIALIAVLSLDRAALDTAATAFLDLRGKYHRPEMGTSIKLLADFAIPVKESNSALWQEKLRHKKPKPEDFAALGKLLGVMRDRRPEQEQRELKGAARRVTAYFDDVAFLLEHRIIKKQIAKNFLNVPGLNIFYEVCVPLLAVENPDSPSIPYARALRDVLSVQGSGMKRYIGDTSASSARPEGASIVQAIRR
jgi:hypothetical protein